MATARKLKSGSWRCLVYDYTDDAGKRKYRSFTSDIPGPAGKRAAELAAAQFAADKKENRNSHTLLFGDALDNYIKKRRNVLSPRSVANYVRLQEVDLAPLAKKNIYDMTQDDVQRFVNEDARQHSPKTVRDNHGLIAAVLKENRPEFALNTALPKLKKPELYIPTDADVSTLMEKSEGTDLELPILLAAFGPMRRGEICALNMSNISGNTVHVIENMVLDENRTWRIKEPKSAAGDRYIQFPDFVAAKWKGKTGRLTTLNPDSLTCRFRRFLKSNGIQHFRFHDLRHYCASIQHALGIPDAYIMQRGGWSNDGVLKNVYRHAMKEKITETDNMANEYFENLCNTKCNTKK